MMNTITLTIAATPDNLRKLAQAFGSSIDDVIGADDVPAVRAAGRPAAEQIAPAKIGNVTEMPAPDLADPSVPEMPKAEKPAKQRTVTKQDVRQQALVLSKAGRNAELGEILARFGAEKLSQVKESDFAALLDELEAVS